ncbi:galactan beta-1,4-galactosyltransferase GALS3-like [Curcuma longa]|uniref:galactan beta-1,4-galactosyltransferase GALS3-like n=1 Tax=Curcuma longa TaxID=136217 RepID=UPI003D9F5F1C
MAKEKHKDDKNFSVAVSWKCAEVKLLLVSLFCICSLITLFELFPSTSSFLSCFSAVDSPPSHPVDLSSSSSSSSSPSLPQIVHPLRAERLGNDSVVKRSFNPVGSAAYLFIQMGAYRGGANNFVAVGLASKPLHVFAKPRFECEWIPHGGGKDSAPIFASGYKILPDWGYGRVYTVVVVNCTFPSAVGLDGSGGRLVIHATTGGGGDREVTTAESFVAVEEAAGSVDESTFSEPPKYEYLYCGSPLYGDLSPQRVREWMAYHARFFGVSKSHFVIHDAGGVHPEVMAVLRPWAEKGMVTLQDIREQERFDGYYHNQFLVVNDCLHRYKFMAKWIFFFDIDEFLYLPPKTSLDSVVSSLAGYSQFTIEQMPMSSKLCQSSASGKTPRMWGMEKLVYRDVKRGVRRDRKYAIQPRSAFATGVHMSQNVAGRSTHKTEGRIRYFHYHGTIADRREPCREFVNATALTYDGTPYVLDDTLRRVAGAVKRFEQKMIGSRLSRTRQ